MPPTFRVLQRVVAPVAPCNAFEETLCFCDAAQSLRCRMQRREWLGMAAVSTHADKAMACRWWLNCEALQCACCSVSLQDGKFVTVGTDKAPPLAPTPTHPHSHAHDRSHAFTHAHPHTHTHTNTHTHTRTHTRARAHTHTRARTLPQTAAIIPPLDRQRSLRPSPAPAAMRPLTVKASERAWAQSARV